jgi:hypothetical protein
MRDGANGVARALSGTHGRQGFTGGNDLSAQVRNLTVNGNTFVFNVPPVGPAGPTTISRCRCPPVPFPQRP